MTTNEKEGLDYNINISNTPSSNTVEKTKINSSNISNDKIIKKETTISNLIQNSNNPCIVFFTLFFKLLSIIFFIFGNFIFKMSDSLQFIFIVIFSSLDFWFVKNISGRILVGLRYWNEIKEDGSENWIFESENEKKNSTIDTKIFWGSIYFTPLFWLIMIPVEFFSFNIMDFLECVISFVFTFTNLYGYYRCSGDQKKKLKGYLKEKSQKGFSKILSYGNINSGK